MADGEIIGAAHDHDSLVAALRQRKAQLALSDATLDAIAGLCAGHAQKLLGAVPVKRVGGVVLGPLLGALGVKLIVAVDAAAAQRMAGRWQRRKEGAVHPALFTLGRARPVILSRLARKAARARWAKTSPEDRAAIGAMLVAARKAKRARTLEAA